MRILYIHQYFATERGRTGTRSLEQARAMQACGHEVTMLISSAQLRDDEIPPGRGVIRRGTIAGLPVIVLHVPYDQRMGYARRIAAFLKFMMLACRVVLGGPRWDLIYASSTPLTVGIPALAGKLFRSIPYFFEVRDLWPDIPVALGVIKDGVLARGLRIAELLIYRHARVIVAANGDMARMIRRKTHNRKPIVAVPNACDIDLFDPDRRDGEFRRLHGLEDKIVCIHAGPFGRVNHLECVLDAAELLGDSETLSFVLIGEGREKLRIQAQVAERGLSNVLILDAIPKQELTAVLADCDIGLVTVIPVAELEWNCSNKFCDYLSSGLPVVLNYRGWHERLLFDHECGLSAGQGDTEAFARAIGRLAGDADLRAGYARRARGLAETVLNRSNVVIPLLDELKTFSSQDMS
ncbi:MAG: glycosyltransferase family 4 protein [Phycisphaerae bacterium]|jgi:glycosyltransferase involved in cell wall biosynthesis|nr:glycosyltransferase family 4 protein [Phycisphaerae bacterium]